MNFQWILLLAVAVTGCRVDNAKLQRDSEETLASLRRRFEAQGLDKEHGKDMQDKRLKALRQLIDSLDTASQEIFFENLCADPKLDSDPAFKSLAAQAFTDRFLERNERAKLRELLEHRCPDYVGTLPLEARLALSDDLKWFSLLFDSYTSAKNSASRSTILRCLERAFPEIREAERPDAGFVAACERWCQGHWSESTVNDNYPHFISSSPIGPARGLFIPKPGATH